MCVFNFEGLRAKIKPGPKPLVCQSALKGLPKIPSRLWPNPQPDTISEVALRCFDSLRRGYPDTNFGFHRSDLEVTTTQTTWASSSFSSLGTLSLSKAHATQTRISASATGFVVEGWGEKEPILGGGGTWVWGRTHSSNTYSYKFGSFMIQSGDHINVELSAETQLQFSFFPSKGVWLQERNRHWINVGFWVMWTLLTQHF